MKEKKHVPTASPDFPRTGILYLVLNIVATLFLGAVLCGVATLPYVPLPPESDHEAAIASRVTFFFGTYYSAYAMAIPILLGIATAIWYRSRWGAAIAGALLMVCAIKFALLAHL